MMKPVFRIIVMLLTYLISSPYAIFSQDTGNWNVWTTADGLTHTAVRVIRVGDSGRVYISPLTDIGINVYDGYSMIQLPDLPNELAVLEGAEGELWAPYLMNQKIAGVQQYKYPSENIAGGEWIAHEIREASEADFYDHQCNRNWSDFRYHKYGKLLPLKQNRILLLLPDKLIEFNSETKTTKTVLRVEDTVLDRFNEMAPSMNGNIWIVGHYNIIKVDRLAIEESTQPTCAPYLNTPLDENYFFFRYAGQFCQLPFENVANELFMPTTSKKDQALFVAHLKNHSVQWIKPQFAKHVLDGVSGNNGSYWVTEWGQTGEGYHLLQYNHFNEVIQHREDKGWINAVEPNEIFWVCNNAGMERHAPSLWQPLPAMNNHALAHTIDKQGRLWIASLLKLYCYENGIWKEPFEFPNDFFDPKLFRGTSFHIHDIACLQDGRLLIPTFCNIFLLFDPSTEQFEIIPHPDKTRKIGEFVHPRMDGTAWIISHASEQTTIFSFQLEIFDGKEARPFLQGKEDWNIGRLFVILESKNGDIWLGGSRGAGLYKSGEYRLLDQTSGFPGSGGLAIAELQNGNIWIADDTSVYEFDGEQWTIVLDGLQYVENIFQSSDGSIWVTTTTGVYRFYNNCWIKYTEENGLRNSITHFTFEYPQGQIWISQRSDGLCQFHPENDPDPPVGLILDKKNLRQIAPGGDTLIVYSGMDKWKYTKTEELLYRYRIDASDWCDYTHDTLAFFRSLHSGRHRFELQVMDQNFNLSKSIFWDFEVLWPWYKQSIFWILFSFTGTIILLLLGFHLFHHFNLERLVAQRTEHLSKANEQLHDNQTKLRTLSQELSIAEERERRQIATDLHDQIGQSLALCKIQTQSIHALSTGTGLEDNLIQLRDSIHQTIQDTRSLTFEISPPVLYEIGLSAAVTWLARNLQEKFGLEIVVQEDDPFDQLNEDLRSFLFRAIRECVINAIKHAQAKKVIVLLNQDKNVIKFRIEDDGAGMKAESERSRKGFGLYAIQERLRLLGGTFTIDSVLGEGTKICISIPGNITMEE